MACKNCDICPGGVLSGDCIDYDGVGISGLNYDEDASINEMIYALGTKIIEVSNQIDDQILYQASRTVTTAELNALPATPITIISAITSRTIAPISVIFKYNHGSAGFTNSAGALLRYIGTAVTFANFANTFPTSANHINIVTPTSTTNSTPSALEGAGVELATAGTFTEGTGTIDITITYYLL